ncbi:NAD(P)/FAD-dependent oxidoreductase [Streptomyces sp. NPDC059650]|uniref:NAD(P)/FAD-dependent oxidoreductase n=1 Tax=Streptomyces sp. NPDC059650 TaxID=3346896 RepID=UPI0036B1E070
MGHHDIGIIGGGCAGLFLARELALLNCDCVVIEKNPAASHASTRNQGWLQSGAFYAATNDIVAARGCREGYEYITRTYRDTILQEVESYYLFRTEQGLAETIERCRRQNIPIAEVTDNEIRQLQATNSILYGTPLDYVARSEDWPFDTHHLLQSIANEIASQGVEHIEVDSMSDIAAARESNSWKVDLGDGKRVDCRTLVLACGAYIPELLQSIAPEISLDIGITKTPVLILQGDQICGPAIMMPLEPGGPNIVPFRTYRDINGVSVCLSRKDLSIGSATDYSLPPKTPEAFAASLDSRLPGIKGLVQASRNNAIVAHFYMCQKLKELTGSSRGPLTKYYEGHQLGVFYPGKFTSSPISAGRFAEDLCTQIGETKVAISHSNPLPVAPQRYYDQADHGVEVVAERLRFRLLQGD